jgi:hypothetical protein
MQNVTMKREGNRLTIEIDLSQDYGPSRTGKTHLVASSHGNRPIPGDDQTYLGLNCYRFTTPRPPRKPKPQTAKA